jgi:hypothetical protein
MRFRSIRTAAAGAVIVAAAFATAAYASHAWGSYHWARASNPFTLKLGDNVSSTWDSHLATTASDWSQSSVLDTTVVAGGTNPKNCRATSGRVEVCNRAYGFNGWLGVASIWISGSHITKGTVKVNDSYFNTSTYNTPAWRNLVMCQEVGHTLGLDHQDEDFDNTPLGTCMDYSADPEPNQHPNAHDYEQLETIYAHLDSFTTVGQTISRAKNGQDDADDPGKPAKGSRGGKPSVYERDLGQGNKLFTFIFWTE